MTLAFSKHCVKMPLKYTFEPNMEVLALRFLKTENKKLRGVKSYN